MESQTCMFLEAPSFQHPLSDIYFVFSPIL